MEGKELQLMIGDFVGIKCVDGSTFNIKVTHLRMDKAKARTHELGTFDKLIDWLQELKDRFVPKQNGTS